MPAIRGYWRKGMNRADAPYLPLTPDVVDQHLRGEVHLGLYPLGDDDTCWWVAADFDKEAAMLDALAYMKAARAHDIPAALEVSQSGRGAHVWIFFAQATSAATARSIATSLLGEAFRLRGSMHLSSYDRLFPSQDIHTGRGMGNLIAAPLNGKRRQHGTTLFIDPATLEPFDDQWAYLSSIARLSHKDVTTLVRTLPDPQFGHRVRRLQLPTSSKIVPRPAAIIRATFTSRLTLTANDLGPAMIAAVKHAASIRNPEFDAASALDAASGTLRASFTGTTRRSRAILCYLVACTGCSPTWSSQLEVHCTSMTSAPSATVTNSSVQPSSGPNKPTQSGD
jgi:hypothetical protein